jgi:asparagine synthase (glutamine-hydrolysing)
VVKQNGVFRPETIERSKKDHVERRASLGYHLRGLMILFLWMKQWKVKTASGLSLPLAAEETVPRQVLS